MPVLQKLACMQGRKDEVPNRELARELANQNNGKGIQEIAENLWNKDKHIEFDYIKVLYEVGYLKPDLVADYVADFIELLSSRQNRLVWGGMLALSTVAALRPQEIYANLDKIMKAIKDGTVITVDNGVKVLARVASTKADYNKKIMPCLLDHM